MNGKLKTWAKRIIRGKVGQLHCFLRRLEEEAEEGRDFDRDEFAYPRLNALFTRIVRRDEAMYAPYVWGTLHAAHLAKSLGIPCIAVIEFGVAGGRGLRCLDRMAVHIRECLQVELRPFGFDTGVGLPPPEDYRDHPNSWSAGMFRMDPAGLRRSLVHARLILGEVRETLPQFVASDAPPVGFVAFDLDYYSSTVPALQLFEADARQLLPRVHCYFDDIMGFTCNDFAGERLAIAEFNRDHAWRKLSPIPGLKYLLPRHHRDAAWTEMLYLAHFFDHPRYNDPDGLTRAAMAAAPPSGVREGDRTPARVAERAAA